MQQQLVQHEIFRHREWKRKVLLKMRKKRFRKRFFSSDFFCQQILETSPIPQKTLRDLVGHSSVHLDNFIPKNGNVSPEEILTIASLAKAKEPRLVLEVGTFDGNTTLQIGLNTPETTKIHTIDLPEGTTLTAKPVLNSDLQFIQDTDKRERRFLGTNVEKKITQHLGDSTAYDFTQFASDGPLDFIFIDGGHSYECVASDTKNALQVLGKDGWMLWHDFTPLFGGVYQYLCELSKELRLHHIEGTNLVIYQRGELQ